MYPEDRRGNGILKVKAMAQIGVAGSIFLAIFGIIQAAQAADPIPASRRIDWTAIYRLGYPNIGNGSLTDS